MARDATYPQQVVLVTARGKAELLGKTLMKDNIITLAWHTPLSFSPELYGISVGKTRFTCKLIQDSKVFAVNFISHDMKDKAVICGTNSGAAIDKFDKCGFTKEECESIDCPKIKEASAVLECEVVDSFETGDHIFFVGKVHKSEQRNDKKRLFHKGGNDFTTTA
ncbi:flavin reductase family protein [Candidatus Woesearchaeota archaeon]|nr:flavin reductase family protein [Candidatus Woesearchaeota archaeon]